jgi:hypothetical protein
MFDTIARYLTNIPDVTARRATQFIVNAIGDRMSSCMISSAGLIINAASSPLAKTGATACNAVANTALLAIPANTVMPALVGTTAQNRFNVYVFYVNNAGTFTSAMGTEAVTLGGIVWPNTPQSSAIVGALSVNPTTAAFVGGTTALDAANTNVVFMSPVGAFDPSIVVGAI